MDFRSSTFLNDGQRGRTFEELTYQDKAIIVALETLVALKNNLQSIADVQTLNSNVTQLIADNEQLQESNAQLNAQVTSLQNQLDQLRAALLQIDVITDEIID